MRWLFWQNIAVASLPVNLTVKNAITVRVFADTNLFVYAESQEQDKTSRAESRDCCNRLRFELEPTINEVVHEQVEQYPTCTTHCRVDAVGQRDSWNWIFQDEFYRLMRF